MAVIAGIVFWLSLGFLAYVYLLYPLLVWLAAVLFERRLDETEFVQAGVSILISSCSNDVARIEKKLNAIAGLDFDKEKITVLLGLDGAEEGVVQACKQFEGEFESLRVFPFLERKGKPFVLNNLLRQAEGDIIVVTDDRQWFEKDSLRELVRPLADDTVGAVSGELVFVDDDAGHKKDVGLYWKYEKFIRENESKFFSLTGVTGAICAFKRRLITAMPNDTILDDVYWPICVLKNQKRIIFQRSAVAYDWAAPAIDGEMRRKIRTLLGNWQLVAREWRFLLNPFKNPVFWQFTSHKFFRLLCPFAMIILYISNMFLLGQGAGWIVFFALQNIFYALAAAGLVDQRLLAYRCFSFPSVFTGLNAAALIGLVAFLKGRYSVKWENGYFGMERSGQ